MCMCWAAGLLDLVQIALDEAMQGGDTVMGHRLLCLRAEIAVFQGDVSLARTALDAVCKGRTSPAASSSTSSPSKSSSSSSTSSGAGLTPITAAHALLTRAVLRGSTDTARTYVVDPLIVVGSPKAGSGPQNPAALTEAAVNTQSLARLAEAMADLTAAESLVREHLVDQGWDGRYVDGVADMAPPRPVVDSVYRPAVLLLASIRARIASTLALRVALGGRGAGSGSGSAGVTAGAGAGTTAGAPTVTTGTWCV